MQIRKIAIGILIVIYTTCCNVSINARNIKSIPTSIYGLQLDELVHLMDTYYVNHISSQRKAEIIYTAFSNILNSLDPYSEYMYGQKLQDFNDQILGKFSGIGVIITNTNQKIEIVSVLKEGPAIKSGIKAGDQIVAVDNYKVQDLDCDISKKIRGLPGTQVLLTVMRDDGKLYQYNITRELIESRVAKYYFDNNILYIRLSKFNINSASELKVIFEKLSHNTIQGIILDLRGNPGGLLDQAIKVADLFINSGLILKCIDRNKNERLFYANEDSYKVPDIPLVTLINSKSASASEVVAGALQYYKRAVIVGTKSFGKALVQDTFPMKSSNNQAKAKITTAYYYTPNGEMIHKRGIIPDVAVETEVQPRDNDIQDSKRIIDNTSNLIDDQEIQYLVNDNQYRKALQILKKI